MTLPSTFARKVFAAAPLAVVLALAACSSGDSARDQALDGLERASQAAALEAEMAGLVAALPDDGAAESEELQASVEEIDSEAEELLASADTGEAFDQQISAAVEKTRGAGGKLTSALEGSSGVGKAKQNAVSDLQGASEDLTAATESIGTELQDDEGNLSAEDAEALEEVVAEVDEAETAVAEASGKPVLAQDGLGIVDFGAPIDETIQLLSEALGPPDEESPAECAVGSESSATTARWGRLRVTGGANAGFFSWGFDLGPTDFAGTPLPDSDLTTPEGLGQDMTADDFRETYGPVTEENPYGVSTEITALRASPTFVGLIDDGQFGDRKGFVQIAAASARLEASGIPEICSALD